MSNSKIKLIFLLIFLTELVSFAGYLSPILEKIAFFAIILLTLALSLYKLEYGLLILLAELFIGSKGYLFSFEQNGLIISIRIALWLIIMSVWLGRNIATWIKVKKITIEFQQSNYFLYFIVFCAFIGWGVINGFLNGNEINNLFFDFNNWLYLFLILPIYEIFKNNKNINLLWQVFIASTAWLSLKTIFLLFTFSHNLIIAFFELYGWVRLTGVGEITQIQGGFYRVFFQSHIFILIAFFAATIILSARVREGNYFKDKKFWLLFSLCCLYLTTILVSFSRSFWVGLLSGILILWIISFFISKIKWREFLAMNGFLFLFLAVSISLTMGIVKFPYPEPMGGFNTASLLSQRASQITGEAGVSSRWLLLPPLWQQIKFNSVLGKGFGATVTYESMDPRVLQNSPSGEYTTYAFEWGWLDIWLKLGFLGLISYLILLGKIISNSWQKQKKHEPTVFASIIIGLIIVSSVSIFSPYMNHPLGLGILMLSAILSENFYRQKNALA